MCLRVTKDSVVQIAQEDIRCFKVLMHNLTSPYRSEPYRLGETKVATIGAMREFGAGAERIDRLSWWVDHAQLAKYELANYMAIDEGLHTFTNEEDAREFISGKHYVLIICEAIIPEGSKYYFGEFDQIRDRSPISFESYVSEKLIVKEPLPALQSVVV